MKQAFVNVEMWALRWALYGCFFVGTAAQWIEPRLVERLKRIGGDA